MLVSLAGTKHCHIPVCVHQRKSRYFIHSMPNAAAVHRVATSTQPCLNALLCSTCDPPAPHLLQHGVPLQAAHFAGPQPCIPRTTGTKACTMAKASALSLGAGVTCEDDLTIGLQNKRQHSAPDHDSYTGATASPVTNPL
jgi:hypothetical protein